MVPDVVTLLVVRSDQIMIVTPFKISPDGELSQVTETKQYNYVERGVPWSRTNEQSFKLGKVGVIIEIKVGACHMRAKGVWSTLFTTGLWSYKT